MKVRVAKTLDELKSMIVDVGDNVLYRGQTKHYGGLNSPAIMTSFDRKGCIPPKMIKWSYYAHGALKYALGQAVDSLEFVQAVLQHYGWRSFYLDLTSSVHAASWFASNGFESDRGIDMCEDCFEEPMWLVKQRARYERQQGSGHIYIIDKAAAVEHHVGLHDLCTMKVQSGRPRFEAQAAWLAGPQRGNLPIECFHSRIIADKQILSDFAAEGDINTTDDLFPPRESDLVLDALLNLPWMEMKLPKDEKGIGIPVFARSLELPEYHDSFKKIHSPNHAFYRGGMISQSVDKGEFEKLPFTIRDIPEDVLFGHPNPYVTRFPKIWEIISEEKFAVFEVSSLIRFPETGSSPSYGKGIAIQRKSKNIVEVSDFEVEHPGMQIAGAGVNYGWHYQVCADGEWQRHIHSKDCPCNNGDRHERLFRSLTILEHWLTKPDDFQTS